MIMKYYYTYRDKYLIVEAPNGHIADEILKELHPDVYMDEHRRSYVAPPDASSRTLTDDVSIKYRDKPEKKFLVYLHEHATRNTQYAKSYMADILNNDEWLDYDHARVYLTIVAASSSEEAIKIGARYAETDERNIGVVEIV